MGKGLRRFKPGVAPKVHLVCAASLWTVVGVLLFYRGVVYLADADMLWLALPGIILGSLKSRIILDRSARKGVERIKRFADNTCIGAVYSWKTWMLVLAMMSMGFWLRNRSVFAPAIGTICIAVGWSLLFSSRHAWSAWYSWENKSH